MNKELFIKQFEKILYDFAIIKDDFENTEFLSQLDAIGFQNRQLTNLINCFSEIEIRDIMDLENQLDVKELTARRNKISRQISTLKKANLS